MKDLPNRHSNFLWSVILHMCVELQVQHDLIFRRKKIAKTYSISERFVNGTQMQNCNLNPIFIYMANKDFLTHNLFSVRQLFNSLVFKNIVNMSHHGNFTRSPALKRGVFVMFTSCSAHSLSV